MSISIIIPAFNAERYLAFTLDSLRNQTLNDWEAIVVNDGSTDTTAEIALKYSQLDPRIRIVSQNNQGLSLSRNNGLSSADPARPLALFLDADDLLEPDALQVLSEELAKFPAAPAVHGMGRYISGEGHDQPALGTFPRERVAVQPNGKTFILHEKAETARSTLVIKNCILSAGAVLIRKNALASVGPWNPKLQSVEDMDMWYRLAGIHPIRYLPRVVLAYRVHGGSMSRKRQVMRRSAMQVRQEWLAHGNKEDRQLIRAGYRVIVRQGAKLRVSTFLKALRSRQWSAATRAFPAAILAVAKTFPGAANAYLLVQSQKTES